MMEKSVIMPKKSFGSYHVEATNVLQHLFKVKGINDHTLHFAADFSGRLDLDRLNQAVNLSADAFPFIRCRFNESKRRACWEDMGYTSDEMVKFVKIENAKDCIMQFLYKEVDAANGPQLNVGLIRSGKMDTLCVTMNHMLCDAAGFKDFLYLLSTIYNKVEENPQYRPKSVMSERKDGQFVKAFSIHDQSKIFFKKYDMFTYDKAKFDFTGSLSNPFIEMRTIPRGQFCQLKAYAKSHGVTVNDVMLAAFIRVLFHLFGRVVAVPCAMDLRKYLPDHKANGICHLVTNLICNIGPDIGATFDITVEKVNRAMNKEKANIGCVENIALMEMAFRLLPYKTARKIVEKSFSNPPIAFTNIGILDKKQLIFGEAEMTGAYMTGSIKYNPYFQLAISTFDDDATFSVNFYGTQSDQNKISLFCDDLAWELRNAK